MKTIKLTSALQPILPLKGKEIGVVINTIKPCGNYFRKVLKKMVHNSKHSLLSLMKEFNSTFKIFLTAGIARAVLGITFTIPFVSSQIFFCVS